MEHTIKNQRGYLLIWAMVLVIIAAFIGNLLVSMFMGKMGSTQNDSKSNAALYIATSGLEIAKRDIAVNHIGCTAINGATKYTNATLFNGMFTAAGTANAASSTLPSGINATNSSITLTSSAGFASSGLIMIENELISYSGISGNTLINAIRGVSTTAATTHAIGASVIQNQCTLTAAGGVPTLISPAGKRIIQQTVFGTAGFTIGSTTPTIASVGSVTINGKGQINSPLITATSPGFPGANVLTASVVNINGQGITQINNGSGSLVTSSDNHLLAGDIIQNYSAITVSNLFNYVFNASKATVQAAADVLINTTVTNFSTLNGLAGGTIWINGGINFNGSGTAIIGTPSSPVILIVNGDVNLTQQANLTVYGIFYVAGSITDNAGYLGYGQTIVEGSITFKGAGTINLDPTILALLGTRASYLQTNYSSSQIGYPQELFP